MIPSLSILVRAIHFVSCRVMSLVQVLFLSVCMFSVSSFLRSVSLPRRFSSVVQSREAQKTSILTLSTESLGSLLGGAGRAKIVWSQFKKTGLDPLSIESKVSVKVRDILTSYTEGFSVIPAVIDSESTSPCGTKKLLLKMKDGQQIETVIIPMGGDDHCTVCVSTQLGCDRRCSFCATGTMGLLRSLSAAEIIAQVLIAQQVVLRDFMPPITNVVYMGMGDAGGNLAAVRESVLCFTDEHRMQISPNKVCVSTVGPRPEIFMELAKLPATLAWSLHSPVDETRKLLVPSTKHTTVELRDGLIAALLSRPNPNHRTVMVSFTLIAGINDSLGEADRIIEFLRPLKEIATKIVVNLIPYNDISSTESLPIAKIPKIALTFTRPSDEAVTAMRLRIMEEPGLWCFRRDTRGEGESAACGMLATKRVKRNTTATTAAVICNE